MAAMTTGTKRVSPSDDRPLKKQKTERRHGACEPCKRSKTKCDGKAPCGACRSEKRKARTCEYSEKARAIAAAREDSERRKTYRYSPDEESEECDFPLQAPHRSSQAKTPHSTASTAMHERIALLQVVDEFIQVKPPKGQALQQIHRVQSGWQELQGLTAQTHTGWLPTVDPDADGPPTTKVGDAGPTTNVAELWRPRLDRILDRINEGSLIEASGLTPSIMRAVELYELNPSRNPQLSDVTASEIDAISITLVEVECILGFFLGTYSFLPAWARSKLGAVDAHRRARDQQADHKDLKGNFELLSFIQELLNIDTSTETGIWDFLHFVQSIKSASNATPIEIMATCITDQDTAEGQRLKLMSNLLFIAIFCRTASICSHYSQPGYSVTPRNGTRSDIIYEMKLVQPRQRGNECGQVIKHAGNALNAFEQLCEIDAEQTAKCWFSLHGALIAAMLLAIHGIREKNAVWEPIHERINRVERRFLELKKFNPQCPIFDKGVNILHQCDQKKPSRTQASRPVGVNSSDTESEGYIEAQNDSDDVSPLFRPHTSHKKRELEDYSCTTSSLREKVRSFSRGESPKIDVNAYAFHLPMTLPSPTTQNMEATEVNVPGRLGYRQPLDIDVSTSFASSQASHIPGTTTHAGILAEPGQQRYWTLDGVPWTNRIPWRFESSHPPMLPAPDSVLLRDEDGRTWECFAPTGMDVRVSFPSQTETAISGQAAYKEQIPNGQLQQGLVSPQLNQQVRVFGANDPAPQQQHVPNRETEGSSFFNMTSKNFEASQVHNLPATKLSSRSSALTRRYSEQNVPTTLGAPTTHIWHVEQTGGSSLPESAASYPTVQDPTTLHNNCYPFTGSEYCHPTHYDHYHSAPYHSGFVGLDGMASHRHFYQSVTTSS